jgi:hypothetical protein
MANSEHLAIVKQGTDALNLWRKKNVVRPDLRGADLRGADLTGANLSGANLTEAHLTRATLGGANLSKAKLRWAYVGWANLNAANLSGADLTNAYLSWANLTETHLTGAHLTGANLTKSNLTEANLIKTNVHGTQVGWTIFASVDLSEVEGLETVEHIGPSTIGIDTIFKSKGIIPQVFLRGCGVPDTFIEYAASLVGQPIEFYSCFISYSTKDGEFAERLHADLQNKGVRCWFAPHDMKIGDKIRDRIDESIRVHDKLLLVLSENSIGSDWVEKEVETAFEEEGKRKRLILFPIRLDNSVMETGRAWAADIRRTRHIGDFSQWKDHDSYKKARERLLRDLGEKPK